MKISAAFYIYCYNKYMKIGIEAERANHPTKTGVEHYAHQLILQFAELDHENEYILYLRTPPQEWIKNLPKNFSYKVMPFPIFWTQLRLSWEFLFKKNRPDVLFIPASSMPIIHPAKTVVTVHDVAFMYYPETYTMFMRYFHMFEDILVSVLAWKIIAVSEATKKDFVKFWRTDEKRITVVHHGFTPQHIIPASSNFPVTSRYPETGTSYVLDAGSESGMTQDLPEKYVLFLSTLQPRKNLEGLIDAFRLLKQEHPELPHKLLVVGKPGWKAEPILQKIEENKDGVVYLNYVTDEARSEIYKKATAFCVPSFYEGFGMWILEAFDASVPVITSNVSSMPEVGGDAAEYCDPKDIQSIKKAIERVLLDPQHADSLVQKGRNRLSIFSWQQCAKKTLELF